MQMQRFELALFLSTGGLEKGLMQERQESIGSPKILVPLQAPKIGPDMQLPAGEAFNACKLAENNGMPA